MRMTRAQLGDVAVAAAVGVFGVVGTAGADHASTGDRRVDLLAFGLVLLGAASLLLRRRLPLVALVGAALSTGVYLVIGYPYGPVWLAYVVAVYSLASRWPTVRALPAGAGALAVTLGHLLTHPGALPGLWGVVPAAAFLTVPFAIGVTVRVTREAAQRERALAVSRRVDDERLRIAQEVHDVVGHGLTAIKMQADIALHLLARKPEQAERALQVISRSSAEALAELRTTLAVVRQPDPDSARAPTPGLHRLDDLGRRMRESGMRVDLQTVGAPRELPPAVDVAAYRIVQEALTNVLRHAAEKVATVRVAYETDAVRIDVSSPAEQVADPPDRRDGMGIPGMRERVTALGGQFTAGPTADRFEVHALLPTGGAA